MKATVRKICHVSAIIPLGLVLFVSGASSQQSYLDVQIITVPSTDPGRFDVYVDSVMMPGGYNMGNGDHSSATPYTAGTHTVTEMANSLSAHPTNLANYTVTFGGACSPTGTFASGSVDLVPGTTECTITNTLTVPPPPPPQLSLASGTGARPYSVSLSESDPTATIFYTDDGTPPTQNSIPYTGPISVNTSLTITAVAVNANGTSAAVAGNYNCGMVTSVDLTIQTGNDDARTDSAIQASLAYDCAPHKCGHTDWCLKPSDSGSYNTCAQTHHGITWGNSSINSSSTNLDLPVAVGDFAQLIIEQAQFGNDNWDLQSLTLVGHIDASPGFPDQVTLLTRSGSSPVKSGSCYARFKHPGGAQVASVAFNFDGSPEYVWDDDGRHQAPYCKEN